MALHKIRKGLDLPLEGAPLQQKSEGNAVSQAGLLGIDSHGLRPDFAVETGQKVKTGQVLYSDRNNPEIKFTSPGTGVVSAINRGERRAFQSIVIDLEKDDPVSFKRFEPGKLNNLKRELVIRQLIESGQWTALRTRPLSRIPAPDKEPRAIFVTAMDTQPLAPAADVLLEGNEEAFQNGLTILLQLTDGSVFVCKAPETVIPEIDSDRLRIESFSGPHPAGNAGTHIHRLFPVDHHREVWSVGLQDVIAIGRLFTEGCLCTDRIISLAGAEVRRPRLIETRAGASISDLTKGELRPGRRRVISGSVFNGHIADGPQGFLGRYHQQVTVIPETHVRRLLGWLNPGLDLYSAKPLMISRLFPRRKISLTTEMHSGVRSIVPIGSYEKVMPLEILPTYLLRALAVDDVDEAVKLGALELDEEDLALCTFVCPSKINHGENLRRVLTICEKEVL